MEPEPVRTGGGRRATDRPRHRHPPRLSFPEARRFSLAGSPMLREVIALTYLDAHGGSRCLIFVTDPEANAEESLAAVAASARGGVDEVMLRMPRLGAGALFEIGERAAGLLAGSGVRLVIHDRVDAALAIPGADIHLGQRSLPPDVVRRLAPDRRIGVSVHSVSEACKAVAMGADCVMFGHVFATPTHPNEPGRGTEMLREVVAAVEVPVIAIGGITTKRVDEVVATGARGIAVIRAISGADRPDAVINELREALDREHAPISLHQGGNDAADGQQ